MKRIFLLIVAAMLMASCEGYFDQVPKTEVSVETSYSTYDSALKSVAILYARLGSADEGINGKERFELVSLISDGIGRPFSQDNQSRVPRDIWKHHYAYIAQANIVIENLEKNAAAINDTYVHSAIDKFQVKTDPVSQLLAEARFLRAYAYFNLYRYFGGVPLVLAPTGPKPAYVPRATRQEMFKFIYDEFQFALENCAANNNGIADGRVSQGAVAGMMVKAKVFHASYIKRAEAYGAKINETVDGDVPVATLYADAIKMADEIFEGKYGTYELEKFFPAVFTKKNKEVMLSALAAEGNGTGNMIPQGFEGEAKQGAAGGSPITTVLPVLYEIPMWEHNYRLKDVSYDYGQIDIFNEVTPKPGTVPAMLQNEYINSGNYSITGDLTRRMWTTCKGIITGPKMGGSPKGLWVFEPIGQFLGDKFFITPGKNNDYTPDQRKVIDKTLAPHERVWWKSVPIAVDNQDVWHIKRHRLAKFRNPNPWELSDVFEIENGGVSYPILRLADIYLLKAEALIQSGMKEEGIACLNVLRDRACNQADLKDMFELQGNAPFEYKAGSVLPIPTTISAEHALKELLYERLRELAGEDDCSWLDIARYPKIMMEDLNDACRYRDPIAGLTFFSDHTLNEYAWDIFNDEKVYKVLLPIPFTELSYFPELQQNPGY